MDLHKLGENIHRIRKQKSYTFEAMAEKTGLSKGLLSRIERGLSAPSLASLRKISAALEVPIVTFFEGSASPDRMVVRKAERKTLHVPDINITYQLLTPDLNNKKIEFLMTEMEPNTHDESPHTHGGEEYGVVIEGQLLISIDGRTVTLDSGDSISFPATLPHCLSNPFGTRSVSIWAIVPPLY